MPRIATRHKNENIIKYKDKATSARSTMTTFESEMETLIHSRVVSEIKSSFLKYYAGHERAEKGAAVKHESRSMLGDS